MSKRQAPFRHQDGSNCWTKNCRLGHKKTAEEQKEEFIKKMVETHKPEDTTPVFIDSIASREAFQAAVENREVTRSRHPEYPFSIYKYSQATTYSKNWNDITLASRGLIVDDETGEILARPFPKFFNYSEGLTPEDKLTGPFRVAEKLDGSLGILYPTPDGLQISTAGGFQSAQAAHATRIYRERYDGNWRPKSNLTYLYEIVYPENRIVVNYGDEDDIYLLGAVNKRTGKSVPLEKLKEWKWKRASEYTEFKSLQDIETVADPGIAHEGYVVHFLESDARVKFKHAEYLKVHRLSTGINERRIHEFMATGQSAQLDEFETQAPEEFEKYIQTTRKTLQAQYNQKEAEVVSVWDKLSASLPADTDQKTFALEVLKQPKHLQPHLFSLRQGKGVNEKNIWQSIQPEFEKGFWAAGTGE